MTREIGGAAGKVWDYLKQNGESSAAKIQKGIKADAVLTNQAIGWLAREGKLAVDRSKKPCKFSLIE